MQPGANPKPSDAGPPMPPVSQEPAPDERFESIVDPVDGTRWEIDAGFLGSNWGCIWDKGCLGVLDKPSPELQQGCCSFGAHLLDEDEARRISALGVSLDPARFQHAAEAAEGGVLAADGPAATRVVDGACIFLNRPGFAGGEGCALHLSAVDDGESPTDMKPAICWQLPLKVDTLEDGTRRLRRWRRQDWGGDDLAWCCTEDRAQADTFSSETPMMETMAEEITALIGREVMVELQARLDR